MEKISPRAKIAMLLLPLALALLAGGYLWYAVSHSRVRATNGPLEKITIGTYVGKINGLLFVADQRGYFQENGLEVTITFCQSGIHALKEARAGNIDLAACAEFALVNEIFAGGDNLRCLSVLGSGNVMEVMARKDRGINRPDDLRGKKIGVPLKTVAEFFLGRFLTFANISLTEVRVVDLAPFNLGAALEKGQVDAIMAWEPLTYEIKKRLGENVIEWPGQSGQDLYWTLVAAEAVVQRKAPALERVLRALAQAEVFLKTNEPEGLAIIARRVGIPEDMLKSNKFAIKYTLSLDQSLLLAMEDEARWMIRNNLTRQRKVPNYLDYIDADALFRVRPKAVGMIIPPKR